MSNTPTELEFDKKMKEILYQVWRDGRDGTDRYESVFNGLHDSKQMFDKHVIGEDEPVFGPQNEAGDISLEDMIHGSRNSLRSEERKALYGGGEK
ncbi:hypothetical protein ACU5JM_08370 [Rhodococcus erythropolis]|uniref:hypothetical protein n=1 Tax=Rhodococcus erythropolis TaxID=1833 RepID=UPI00406BA60E